MTDDEIRAMLAASEKEDEEFRRLGFGTPNVAGRETLLAREALARGEALAKARVKDQEATEVLEWAAAFLVDHGCVEEFIGVWMRKDWNDGKSMRDALERIVQEIEERDA